MVVILCGISTVQVIANVRSLIKQTPSICSHLNLGVALARHNFKCVKIRII